MELAHAAADLNATTMAIVRRVFLSGSVMDVVITFSIAANATCHCYRPMLRCDASWIRRKLRVWLHFWRPTPLPP